MSTTSSGSEWSGDMLDRPEMMEAFATQLRRSLSDQAERLARIRRDAEAMWEANPPEGYGSFEAWWRHRWVAGPFAAIQDHIEKAATLTFQLEARYRRGRHEIPATRQAAAAAREATAIPQHRTNHAVPGVAARPADAPTDAPPGGDFMSMVRGDGRRRSA